MKQNARVSTLTASTRAAASASGAGKILPESIARIANPDFSGRKTSARSTRTRAGPASANRFAAQPERVTETRKPMRCRKSIREIAFARKGLPEPFATRLKSVTSTIKLKDPYLNLSPQKNKL